MFSCSLFFLLLCWGFPSQVTEETVVLKHHGIFHVMVYNAAVILLKLFGFWGVFFCLMMIDVLCFK